MLRKILNFLLYMKWTDCRHEKLEPTGMMGWRCEKCKAPVRD